MRSKTIPDAMCWWHEADGRGYQTRILRNEPLFFDNFHAHHVVAGVQVYSAHAARVPSDETHLALLQCTACGQALLMVNQEPRTSRILDHRKDAFVYN